MRKSVHLVGYSHVKYTHSAKMSRSQDEWGSARHKRLTCGVRYRIYEVECRTLFR